MSKLSNMSKMHSKQGTSFVVLQAWASWESLHPGAHRDVTLTTANKAFLHTNTFHMVTAGQQRVSKKVLIKEHKEHNKESEVFIQLQIFQDTNLMGFDVENKLLLKKNPPRRPWESTGTANVPTSDVTRPSTDVFISPCSCAQRRLAAKTLNYSVSSRS